MTPKTFMLIAGETSGDLLASELVGALREKLPSATFSAPAEQKCRRSESIWPLT